MDFSRSMTDFLTSFIFLYMVNGKRITLMYLKIGSRNFRYMSDELRF